MLSPLFGMSRSSNPSLSPASGPKNESVTSRLSLSDIEQSHNFEPAYPNRIAHAYPGKPNTLWRKLGEYFSKQPVSAPDSERSYAEILQRYNTACPDKKVRAVDFGGRNLIELMSNRDYRERCAKDPAWKKTIVDTWNIDAPLDHFICHASLPAYTVSQELAKVLGADKNLEGPVARAYKQHLLKI